MALRKSTEDSAEVELSAKFWTPPVPTKPPLPQVNAVGLPVPPRATTKGVEWAAKPTPPVVLARENPKVTVPLPAEADGARERVNSPLICRMATDVAEVGVSANGLRLGSTAAVLSPRMPSLTVVAPV